VNDGSIFTAGEYYFTPVVYGNATGTGNVTALTMDPACTYTGNSVHVFLLVSGDPLCAIGIAELAHNGFSASAFLQDANTINVKINTVTAEKAVINVYDVMGRVVSTTKCSLVNGENTELMNASMLGAGTYFISVETGTAKAVSKLVKL
jgi:hypothetical protein